MRRFCCLFVLCVFTFSGITQNASIYTPSYRHYTLNDGLAQSQVMCIFQDSRGYIWMGTKGGISKFNGERFENFYENDSIPVGEARYILEDHKKNIWVFSIQGAGYYDGIKWKKVSNIGLECLKLLDTVIMGWNYRDSSIYSITTDRAKVSKRLVLSDFHLKEIIPIRNDAFYFGITRNGINKFYQYTEEHGIELIRSVVESQLNQYILESDSMHLFYNMGKSDIDLTYSMDKNKYLSLPVFDNRPDHYANLRYANSGSNEILSTNNIIYRIKPDHSGYEQLLELNAGVLQIMIATDESIWIASENGVYQIFPAQFRFISGKIIPQPWSIIEGQPGEFYVSCYGFGLKKIQNARISDVRIPLNLFTNKGAWTDFYFGASKDRYGSMYFPHSEYAINLSSKGVWRVIPSFHSIDKRMNSVVLMSMYDSIDNKVLFAMKKGVAIFDIQSKTMESILLDSINEGFILSMTRDLDGNYWFGSGPVWKYNIKTKTHEVYKRSNKKIDFCCVLAMETDLKNGVWFATRSNGLNYLSPERDSFIQIAANIIDHTLYNLKVVDSFLIAGGLQGLFLINLNEFYRSGKVKVKSYNSHNGFPGIEPNQNASYLDSKGNYWVLCANGIVTTHKSSFSMQADPARIRIFQVNDRRISYDTSSTIMLSKNENQLTIRFESIGFERTVIPQYSWRLMGSNDQWSSWSQDQIAFYSNLPSNGYTFEVRSRHPGSEDEEYLSGDSYSFKVNNVFYKEPFFYKYTLLGSIALSLAFLGLTRSIRANKKATKAAKALAEKREHLMKYYQIQSLQAQLNPHFIFNLLSTIQGYISHDMKDKAKEYLQRLSKLMRRFLESSVSSDLQHMLHSNQDISLEKEIELLTYYIELEQSLHEGKFEYKIEIDPSLNPSNVYIPPMMIQPFIENSIKHGLVPLKDSRPGILSVLFSKDYEDILCQIEDNGMGFGENNLSAKKDQVKSHGVKLVKERAALLSDFGFKIDIHTESISNIGTTVTIRFSDNTT